MATLTALSLAAFGDIGVVTGGLVEGALVTVGSSVAATHWNVGGGTRGGAGWSRSGGVYGKKSRVRTSLWMWRVGHSNV